MSRPEIEVRLLPAAESDLSEALAYIAADRPGAADALLLKFIKHLTLLSRNPRLGRSAEEEDLSRMGYRYLIVENYLVFYTIEGKTIYVHRIVHGARDYLNVR